jgi:hypothetical protein
MLKYVLGFVLVFGLAVYIAVQDERATQQSTQETKQASNGTVAAVPNADHPQQNVPNAERNLPSWYGFFRWPNGTTTWAILLTLLAIAEQTRLLEQYVAATVKGVNNAARSERAWVIPEVAPFAKQKSGQWHRWVGGGKTEPMSVVDILKGEHLRHGLKFVNMGRTVARISAYQIHIGLWDHKKESLTVQHIQYKGDLDRMLAGSETTEVLADEVIDIHQIASDPASELDTWKNWLVILVSVSYRHIFSGAEFETEVFRFVYDPKKMSVSRKATTEADEKQARKPEMYPPPPTIPN